MITLPTICYALVTAGFTIGGSAGVMAYAQNADKVAQLVAGLAALLLGNAFWVAMIRSVPGANFGTIMLISSVAVLIGSQLLAATVFRTEITSQQIFAVLLAISAMSLASVR